VAAKLAKGSVREFLLNTFILPLYILVDNQCFTSLNDVERMGLSFNPPSIDAWAQFVWENNAQTFSWCGCRLLQRPEYAVLSQQNLTQKRWVLARNL
jgi:hypothetical protein